MVLVKWVHGTSKKLVTHALSTIELPDKWMFSFMLSRNSNDKITREFMTALIFIYQRRWLTSESSNSAEAFPAGYKHWKGNEFHQAKS